MLVERDVKGLCFGLLMRRGGTLTAARLRRLHRPQRSTQLQSNERIRAWGRHVVSVVIRRRECGIVSQSGCVAGMRASDMLPGYYRKHAGQVTAAVTISMAQCAQQSLDDQKVTC